MVARSRAANGISSFSSYAVKQRSTERLSRTRTLGLQNQIKSVANTINSNRTNTNPSSSSGSYLDGIDYGGTSTQTNPVNSSHVQNIQNTIDSLRNLRQTQTGDKKVEVAQQIVSLQKEMIHATAQEQGVGADVGPRTLRARNNFTNALQGVINEAERYNQTGVYREGISTQLLEKLQDSMNADFFKLVGTEEGQALLDQVDQMGVNLSQENIDFINKHTGVVDILYGNYEADLAMAETSQQQSSEPITNTTSNSVTSTRANELQDSIDSLSGLRQAESIGRKGIFSKAIIGHQKEMIKEIAQEQGWGAEVGAETLSARDNFFDALQGVVSEAERYNRTGVYREGFSTQLLEKLQDSMNADLFKLVGTEEGQTFLDQIDSMTGNLSQENIDFINKHTGVVDILYGNYNADLAIGEENKVATVGSDNIDSGALTSSQKNQVTALLIDWESELILGGTDVGNIYRDNELKTLVGEIADILGESHDDSNFTGVSRQIYDNFSDQQKYDSNGKSILSSLTVDKMIDFVADLPGGPVTQAYDPEKLTSSLDTLTLSMDDLDRRAALPSNNDRLFEIKYERMKLERAYAFLEEFSTEAR